MSRSTYHDLQTGSPHNNGSLFAKVSFDKGQLLLLLLKHFEWGGRNDVINKRKCKCFFSGTSSIFSVIYRWTFNSFGIWNEWNKWAWDIFAPISVIDRPLTLKSCKIWNSLHSEVGIGAVLQKISEHQSCRGLFNSSDARSALRCQRADLVRRGKQ